MRKAFDAIATGMIAHLRQNSDAKVLGVVQSDTTYVRVVYEWLVLPAVLALASGIFLIMTMIKARRDVGRRIWKSSQTAMLMHGLDNRDHFGPLVYTEEIEKFSKSTRVRLALEGLGWRFVHDGKPEK